MNKNTLTALMLSGLLGIASVSALADSTGPTNPVDTTKTPASGMEKNTDGTTTGAPGTTPGVKGMDPKPKDGNSGAGGMTNDEGMGSGGGAKPGGKAGGSGSAGSGG